MTRMLIVSTFALLATAACAPPVTEPLPPPAVLVQTVGESEAANGRYFTGDIQPRHASALGFRVGGKLLERAVDVGSRVKTGQMLARLDATDTQLSANAARAALAAARSDLALARAELERVQALRTKNFVSESAVDAQRTAVDAATARVRQARSQTALATNQNEYTTLDADADGVVTAVNADVGQVLAAGEPVLTLAHDGARDVRINVPEGQAATLSVGVAARVRLWSAPDEIFPARVREVAPAADAVTRTYRVKVQVEAPPDRLPLGATATVALANGEPSGVILPLRALGERDGQSVVWVFDAAAGSVAPVPVTVAQFSERGVRIESGVAPGAQVVVTGIRLLQPGQQVRAVPASAPVTLDATR